MIPAKIPDGYLMLCLDPKITKYLNKAIELNQWSDGSFKVLYLAKPNIWVWLAL